MLVVIDHSSPVSLAEQIAAAVRRALAEGTLHMGERLPAARSLARTLDINVHTVLRGYQILKEEHLIDLRPGRGAVVMAASSPTQALVVDACRHFAHLARRAGLTEPDVLEMARSLFRTAT
ncbi:GntR family transcriptional regulator [Streptomyces sp. CB00455]|uniref:GntR family transcriptional regulator n=1 Tax=Streptomyces sp. CB00455 TaxID=1703927 RepID=UPI00094064F8|nr:GntR family transcriptional regulator [Streptomyces sp. CB00455]OKK14788.1 GntR family transcriptional regulator [Streptomyces sp. CB00455]